MTFTEKSFWWIHPPTIILCYYDRCDSAFIKAIVYRIVCSLDSPCSPCSGFPETMIIAACPSHTSVTFSPRSVAFDTPVFITSREIGEGAMSPGTPAGQIRVKRNAKEFVWFGRALCAGEEQMHWARSAVGPGRNQMEERRNSGKREEMVFPRVKAPFRSPLVQRVSDECVCVCNSETMWNVTSDLSAGCNKTLSYLYNKGT